MGVIFYLHMKEMHKKSNLIQFFLGNKHLATVVYLKICTECQYISKAVLIGFSILLPPYLHTVIPFCIFKLLGYIWRLYSWGTFHNNTISMRHSSVISCIFASIHPKRMMLQVEHWLWKYYISRQQIHKCQGLMHFQNVV
jgi:hypothetical protein